MSSNNGRTSDGLPKYYGGVWSLCWADLPHYHWDKRVSSAKIRAQEDPQTFLESAYTDYDRAAYDAKVEDVLRTEDFDVVLCPGGMLHPGHFITYNTVARKVSPGKIVFYWEWPYATRAHGLHLWGGLMRRHNLSEIPMLPTPGKSFVFRQLYPTEVHLLRPPYGSDSGLDTFEEHYAAANRDLMKELLRAPVVHQDYRAKVHMYDAQSLRPRELEHSQGVLGHEGRTHQQLFKQAGCWEHIMVAIENHIDDQSARQAMYLLMGMKPDKLKLQRTINGMIESGACKPGLFRKLVPMMHYAYGTLEAPAHV